MIENLDVFLQGLDSKPIVIHEIAGDRTITGYFDNAFFDAQIGETRLDDTQPRITCKASDVVNVPDETGVTVDGAAYSIIQKQPDGNGFTILKLAHE